MEEVEMAIPHNVVIADNAANWLRWGNLVDSWIDNPGIRPNTVGGLRTAMENANVTGTIKGNANRPVQIDSYPGAALVIPIPPRAMMNLDDAELDRIWSLGAGQRFYPVPGFYAEIFLGNPPKADFTTRQQLTDMARRRLGEYVINECC
jgi:hypothetical protein